MPRPERWPMRCRFRLSHGRQQGYLVPPTPSPLHLHSQPLPPVAPLRSYLPPFRVIQFRGVRHQREGARDQDRPKTLRLKHTGSPETDEFQQRKKCHDYYQAVARSLEQRHEVHRLLAFQSFQNYIHPIADGQVIRNNFNELLPRISLENTLQGIDQIEQPDVLEQLFVGLQIFRNNRGACINIPPHAFLSIQLARRLFERLVFKQTPDQFFARIRPLELILRGFIHRKQHLGLDLEQRCSPDEKLAGDGQVQIFHRLDVLEILPGDEVNGNVVDVDLVLLDEVQEKIERPLKVLDSNLIGQFGLFGTVKLVIHKGLYTSFGGG